MPMTIKFRPVPAAIDVDDVFADGHHVGRIEQSETYKDRYHLILNNRPAQLAGYNLTTARKAAKTEVPKLLARLGDFDEVAEKNPPRRVERVVRTVVKADDSSFPYEVKVKTTFLDDSTTQYELGPYGTFDEALEAAQPAGYCDDEVVVIDASAEEAALADPETEPTSFVEHTILACLELKHAAQLNWLAELVAERMPTGERIPTAELIDACCDLEARGLVERNGRTWLLAS